MKNLIKAIADFQQDCPVILKDTSGYGYKYADLTQIDSVIKPLLKKHGLAYVQPLMDDKIKTILFHVETGEQIESLCTIPFESIKYEPVVIETTKNNVTEKKTKYIIAGFEGMNTAQAYGSLITYFRRYTISSLLGLITDKDTDGTGQQQEQQQKQPAQTSPPKQTSPLTPEQQSTIDSWKLHEEEIKVMVAAVKTPEDLTIIKESFTELINHKGFIALLTNKYKEISK